MDDQDVPAEVPGFVSAAVLAARLGVSRSTVHRWSESGVLPAPVRLAGRLVWRAEDLPATVVRPRMGNPNWTRRGDGS